MSQLLQNTILEKEFLEMKLLHICQNALVSEVLLLTK